MKYWNSRRIQKMKERAARRAEREAQTAAVAQEQERSYTPGSAKKNAELMLDALGLPLRRRMVARLRDGGAMSLSKLVDPFNITLPTAFAHLRALERAGIIVTHKHGRVRMCVYNKKAFEELATWLVK